MPNGTHETAAVVWVEAWDEDEGERRYVATREPADPAVSSLFPVPADLLARCEAAREAYNDARREMLALQRHHHRALADARAERARAASVQALRAAGYTVTEPGAET